MNPGNIFIKPTNGWQLSGHLSPVLNHMISARFPIRYSAVSGHHAPTVSHVRRLSHLNRSLTYFARLLYVIINVRNSHFELFIVLHVNHTDNRG